MDTLISIKQDINSHIRHVYLSTHSNNFWYWASKSGKKIKDF